MVSVRGYPPRIVAPRWSVPNAPSARSARHWSTWPLATRRAIGVGLLALAVVVPLFRQAGTASWHSVFAEDGSVYTAQAVRSGGVAVLFRGYAGYLQLPPRLLGALTPYVPFRYLTLYLALAGTAVVAMLAWFQLWASKGWVNSSLLRFLLAALVVLSPVMGGENTANITNTIWAFVAVLPWALISTRERSRDTMVRAAVVFLAATATALSFLFVPLAIGWVLVRRTRSSLAVTLSFAAGLVIQGLVTLHTPSAQSFVYGSSRSVAQMRDGISLRVFGEFLVGPKPLHPLWLHDWRAVVILAPLIVLAVFAAVFPGAGRRAQLMALILTGYAVVLFVVPVWGRGTWTLFLQEGMPLRNASMRYSVVPLFLLASALVVLIAPPLVANRSRARVAGFVLVAQMSLLMVVNFQTVTIDSHQKNWHQEVSHLYVTACAGRPEDRLVTVPSFMPVVVPCRQLRP